MNPLDALRLSKNLCALFPTKAEAPMAYAIAIEGYDATLMEAAVKDVAATFEKMPTVRQLIAAYRKAEADSKVPDVCATRDPMCAECAKDGVAVESIPPFTGRQRYRDDEDNDLGPVWLHPPMCARHARGFAMERPTRPNWHGDRVAVVGYGPS